ncbi:hypothetical protein COBT_003234, partial [Conglomerata obtusa]
KFGKRKYNCGHKVLGVWVVKLVERTARRQIIVLPVSQRNKETLHNIIKKFFKEGSINMNDVCKGYDDIDQYAYKNYVINRLIIYQRYGDGLSIRTNTIDG